MLTLRPQSTQHSLWSQLCTCEVLWLRLELLWHYHVKIYPKTHSSTLTKALNNASLLVSIMIVVFHDHILPSWLTHRILQLFLLVHCIDFHLLYTAQTSPNQCPSNPSINKNHSSHHRPNPYHDMNFCCLWSPWGPLVCACEWVIVCLSC